jgi:histidinol-phosphate phosphatase family protein
MSTNKNTTTLFLDRDGVINVFDKRNYVNSPEDFLFFPKALDAFRILATHFDHIFVVTNQAGVGYGYMNKETLHDIHTHMEKQVALAGGRIDRVYYCPDRVSKASPCRKPNGGMAKQAQKDFPAVNFQNSWMVGDMDSDIEFGKRLDMRTVRIVHEDLDSAIKSPIQADYYFSNLFEFAQWVEESI